MSAIPAQSPDVPSPPAPSAPDAGAPAAQSRRRVPGWARTLSVVGVVAGLMVLMFRGWYRGELIPPWDFLGSYNTEAFAWWTDGGFFNPPDWMPYAWSGYPAALSLQNSAWYLPVGFAAALRPFTLHASAVLNSVHIGFGALGTYALVRAFRLPYGVALLAAVAGFFAVGHYSNAEHIDIGRGYAFLPWVLLVLSPAWPWRRWWSIPVGTLILWQTVTGAYPGMLTAMFYGGLCWVGHHLWVSRPRVTAYLLPLVTAAVGALLLSAPRLLPYLMLLKGATPGFKEQSWFTFPMLGTLVFGYGGDLPNDISMRSFFVPASVLTLAAFARWKDPVTRAATSILVPAFLLGMPFLPWFQWAQRLPGLSLSRYTMSDFKALLVLGVVLLACSGLLSLSQLATLRLRELPRGVWLRLSLILGFTALMLQIALTGPYERYEWFRPSLSLWAAVLSILGLLILPRTRWLFPLFVTGMVGLTAASGVIWARTTSAPWSTPRISAEVDAYGDTVWSLIQQRKPPAVGRQRAARLPPGDALTEHALHTSRWSRTFYDGSNAIGGYVNLKGSRTQWSLMVNLTHPVHGPGFAAFMAAPGSILAMPAGQRPSASDLVACARAPSSCGPVTTEPVHYAPGRHAFRITSGRDVTGYFNEPYYPGWTAQLCTPEGTGCRSVEASGSDLGVLTVEVPAGAHLLRVDYVTRGRTTGWVLFGLGVLLLAAGALLTLRSSSAAPRWNPAP